MLEQIFHFLAGTLAITSSLVTTVMGGVAIWAWIFRRKEIERFLHALMGTHLSHRVNRMKETLGQLDYLDFDEKDHRKEIRALLGRLCGQLKSIVTDYPEIAPTYDTVVKLQDNTVQLTESRKRQVISEIHDVLDIKIFEHHSNGGKEKSGR